jgi:carboxymethylenebutenolidase
LGKQFTLTSADKFQLGAYRADPLAAAKGGIVVIQEIFGVNHHIRAVCDRLAAEGYSAVAPALFDRQVKDFQSGYSPDEIAEARKFVANPDWNAMLRDTQSAIDTLKPTGPVAIMGFCMGGTIAFRVLLRRTDREECRREAEGADAAAFRREGCVDPDERRRDRQTEARRR